MEDEQTDKTDTQGDKADKPEEKDKELSEYEKAVELVKRREEVTKIELEVLAKKEKLAANELLAGTSGGHVKPEPAKEESPKEYNERIEKEISEGKHDD